MTQTALNRRQVLNASGSDLNVMVAEHIFGWRRITGPTHDYDGPVEHGEVLVPPNMSEFPAYAMMPPRGSVSLSYFINRNWSQDISAAWEVESEILQKHSAVRTRYVWRLKLVTDWEDKQPHNREEMKLIHATPEQRCKAALLAVLDL